MSYTREGVGGGGEWVLDNVLFAEALLPFYIPFLTEKEPFRILSIDKRYPFNFT